MAASWALSTVLMNVVFQQKQNESRMNLGLISSFSVMPEMSPLDVFFRGIFAFLSRGDITPVTRTHIYRKYISTRFLIKIIFFHFPPKEKISYFLEKRNTIFPDITKKNHAQAQTFWKDHLSKTFGKKIWFFGQCWSFDRHYIQNPL